MRRIAGTEEGSVVFVASPHNLTSYTLVCYPDVHHPPHPTEHRTPMPIRRLSPETRRAVLAAARCGVPVIVLRRALGLNKTTARAIVRDDLPGYDDLYAEWDAIGSEAFVHRYLTPAFVQLVNQNARTGCLVGGAWRSNAAL